MINAVNLIYLYIYIIFTIVKGNLVNGIDSFNIYIYVEMLLCLYIYICNFNLFLLNYLNKYIL